MSTKIARCHARRATQESRLIRRARTIHHLTVDGTKYCRYVISGRKINYFGHCAIGIPRVPALRRNVTRGKAPLLHPPRDPSTTLSTPVGIENSSQQAEATVLPRFSRRLSRMNLLGTSTLLGCCGDNNATRSLHPCSLRLSFEFALRTFRSETASGLPTFAYVEINCTARHVHV